MAKVAEVFVETLVKAGVKRVYGVAGDSLNGITEAIRATDGIDWLMERHGGGCGVCGRSRGGDDRRVDGMRGKLRPGNLHLINGLHDCHRSRVPVLAIAAQVPSSEIGTNYFQETRPEHLFMTCSDFCEVVTQAQQIPRVLGIAMRTAMAK